MSEIILADFNGRTWLVGGEDYIDDLLANTLAPGITIEVVPCTTKAEVMALWVQHCGEPNRTGDPWMINPAIAKRVRDVTADHAVFFAQWSAMLDQDAQTVIAAAATFALSEQGLPVVVTEYLDDGAPQSLADLSRLRAHLIEEKLVEAGIHRGRLGRARRATGEVPGMAQESQRLDIIIREGVREA